MLDSNVKLFQMIRTKKYFIDRIFRFKSHNKKRCFDYHLYKRIFNTFALVLIQILKTKHHEEWIMEKKGYIAYCGTPIFWVKFKFHFWKTSFFKKINNLVRCSWTSWFWQSPKLLCPPKRMSGIRKIIWGSWISSNCK